MIRTLLNIVFKLILRIWAPWIHLTHRLLRILTSPLSLIFNKIFSRCSSVVYTTIILVCTSLVLLWTSVLLYGSFYNSYVPTVSHQRDVNLVFRADCELSGGGMCTFPTANLTLGTSRNAEILRKGQAYQVVLELDMPETLVNQQLGMFMIELKFYTYGGTIIQKASRAVSGMLRYKSYLLQIAETIFYLPLLLFGYSEQKQTLDVELFKSYVEDTYKPTIGVIIEVQTRAVHIYNSVLHLNAVFSGLRYFMYSWPFTSSLLGIVTIFFFLAVGVLLSFYNFGTSNEKFETVSEYVTPATDFQDDEIDKLSLMREDEEPGNRGTPDGDRSTEDNTPSLSDDDGDDDKGLSSKVQDVLSSQLSTVRHRKYPEHTKS